VDSTAAKTAIGTSAAAFQSGWARLDRFPEGLVTSSLPTISRSHLTPIVQLQSVCHKGAGDLNLVRGRRAINLMPSALSDATNVRRCPLRSHELRDRRPDITADLAQQGGRDITPGMHRHGRDAAVGVAELLVRATLADLDETQPLEAGDNLARLEDRDRAQGRRLSDENRLRPDELRLERGLAILDEHGDHLAQVGVEFVETIALAVRAREARDIPDEDAGFRVALDDSGVSAHSD